jgi:hypothetical protein
MTKKTRNEYIALAVILLILVFLLYHYVFSGSKAPVASSTLTTTPDVVTTGATATVAPGAAFSPSIASTGEFLPNGPTLDTSVLQDPIFNSLVPLPQFTVSSAQVGIADPFASSAADTTTTVLATTPVVAGQETTTPATTK